VTRDQESTIIGANILQFPLLFVSSAFLPLSVMPGWIQTVAMFNPITYGVDAARALTLGEGRRDGDRGDAIPAASGTRWSRH